MNWVRRGSVGWVERMIDVKIRLLNKAQLKEPWRASVFTPVARVASQVLTMAAAL